MTSGPSADRRADELYAGLRNRYGADHALYNGYRTQAYFRREQKMVLHALAECEGVLLDVACGSGLMVRPLTATRLVLGLDYNDHACRAARGNGLRIVRGDAFALPFADASIDQISSCQFFNQQHKAAVSQFVLEAARCLRPGGRLVLVWRNGRAWVHRVAHALLTVWDRIVGRPTFHNHDHSLDEVRGYGEAGDLTVLRAEVTFPQWGWRTSRTSGIAASLIGASCFLILVKPEASLKPSNTST